MDFRTAPPLDAERNRSQMLGSTEKCSCHSYDERCKTRLSTIWQESEVRLEELCRERGLASIGYRSNRLPARATCSLYSMRREFTAALLFFSAVAIWQLSSASVSFSILHTGYARNDFFRAHLAQTTLNCNSLAYNAHLRPNLRVMCVKLRALPYSRQKTDFDAISNW